MLRGRIASCDAVIHLVGEVYGAEPQTRQPREPRRSYTHLEYDLARELGKPVYVFFCGADFPYDAHAAEDAERQALQGAHRAALMESDSLRCEIYTKEELALRVRELQTRVEHLGAELKRTRSWLGRGVATGLLLVAVLAAGLWWLRQRADETATRVAAQATQAAKQQDEIGELRARLAKQAELTTAVLSRLAGADANASLEDARDPILTAQAAIAFQRSMSVADLRQQLATEGADVRQLLVLVERRRAEVSKTDKELNALQRDTLIKLAQSEFAGARYNQAVTALQSALAVTPRAEQPILWAELQDRLGAAFTASVPTSNAPDTVEHVAAALAAHRAALGVFERARHPLEWARIQAHLGDALRLSARNLAMTKGGTLTQEAVVAYRAALEVFDRVRTPREWAATQRSLAFALSDLKHTPETLAAAETACRAALSNFPREADAIEWAATMHRLGSILTHRARLAQGEEKALLAADGVAACRAAMEVRTRTAMPIEWHLTSFQLSSALFVRAFSRGADRAAVLGEALTIMEAATEIDLPDLLRARALVQRGRVRLNQASLAPEAERVAIYAEAAASQRAALKAFSLELTPTDWLTAQYGLAWALHGQAQSAEGPEKIRLRRDVIDAARALKAANDPDFMADALYFLAENLRLLAGTETGEARRRDLIEAVDAYREALRQKEPGDFSATTISKNCGLALQALARDAEGAERLKYWNESAATLRAAIKDTGMARLSKLNQADVHFSLGIALENSGNVGPTDGQDALFAEAAGAFAAALSLRSRETAAREWANAQYSLGRLLFKQAERAPRAEQTALHTSAVTALRAALDVYTETAFPAERVQVIEWLARAESRPATLTK